MSGTLALYTIGGAVLALAVPRVRRRLALSMAKHPSLTGHARLSRRVAAMLPGVRYDDATFYDCDGAPSEVAARRRAAFQRLSVEYARRFPKTVAMTREVRESIPDLQFTGAYRVPFQFSEMVRAHLAVGAFLESSSGGMFTDLDGNQFIDVAGSYGVNVFGNDFYRRCVAEGIARTQALGPVLGAYHPCVAENVRRLREISGLDAVSFHMSGTEAVMQSVRLARYHTRRTHLVRFCGAYHGWWGDVQPGVGNPIPANETYTLRDMHTRSLEVLRTRRDIACVLVNPLQALHPNANAPGDSSLIDSGRRAGFDRQGYAAWLQALRAVCTERGIVLIFDEVFLGFRLAPGGAQEYFGVRADMVTYGKTLGGGLPVGVVCGRADLMKRYREERPADICFARGTFNAHPYVMGAMNAFLEQLGSEELQRCYAQADAVWNARASSMNRALESAGVPVRVANLQSIWTVLYTEPSRYNWMLQFYLRLEGLALSWVGSGRLIFSLDLTEAAFEEIARRFVAAAVAMHEDGWWWRSPELTDRAIRRGILREAFSRRR